MVPAFRSPICGSSDLGLARRLDVHRDAVEGCVAGELVEEELVGQVVDADAGVALGGGQGDAGAVVAPAVRDAHYAGHDFGGELGGQGLSLIHI